ncbi:TRAP transporter small permease subunit [Tabrizicola sp. YIM 78059]|uniref:TRAP transporter small permease subunit n=1 Tax=Tabrizicola sp. YIM 78059 TaxID=2529861 RepID=UPI0020BD8C72|nr:TRAP transporter small permease subunit [Tabrizicola sp. YIM 78059]
MYLLFVLMGILLWSTISKFSRPSLWTLEAAQFVMIAYFVLGGPWSMQAGAHVRMDLFYHRWTPRRRTQVDAITVFALGFYLAVMLWGALDSTAYSLGLKWTMIEVGWLPFDLPWPQTGFMERSPSAWRPVLWPVKVIMCVGLLLMLLQSLAFLIRDVAILRSISIPPGRGYADPDQPGTEDISA